jgi:uncharacterized protein (UPF0276 family)
MKFALNYSRPALALHRDDSSAFDLFKLPAWDTLVDEVSTVHPAYVHFPLSVTGGDGTVCDGETKLPADFARIEKFMAQTGTPLVNIHLAPSIRDNPDLASDDFSASAAEEITRRMICDVSSLTRHFGPEKVIAENDTGDTGMVNAAILPEVINSVIRETGCGLLLDLAHAQIAARALSMDTKDYLSRLPTDRLGEMHITGVHYLGHEWQERIRASGAVPPEKLPRYRDRWMDHLPITSKDWELIEWATEQIRDGAWKEPWVASCEYGGLGGFFEAVMDEDIIREQIPRLGKILKG